MSARCEDSRIGSSATRRRATATRSPAGSFAQSPLCSLDRNAAQTRPFRRQPILKALVVDRGVGQQLAAEEVEALAQEQRIVRIGEPQELQDVDLGCRDVELDPVVRRRQHRRDDRREIMAQLCQGLSQATARLSVRSVAPQQARQLLAARRTGWRKREHAEHRPVLPGRHVDEPAIGVEKLAAAEQPNCEAGHSSRSPPVPARRNAAALFALLTILITQFRAGFTLLRRPHDG